MAESKEQMERLTRAYIGPNKAHQQFVQQLTNEKVFVFLFMKNKESLFSTFENEIETVRQKSRMMGSQDFSLGVITKVLSPTQSMGIFIRENESTLIAKDFAEFEGQVYGKAYTEVHRVFVNYQIDLYREIAEKHPDTPGCDRLSHKYPREKAFNEIHLPIIPHKETGGNASEELETRLNELESIRHVVEHNNGIVDKTFIQRNPMTIMNFGERISIGPEQIGKAIALVETLAENLNKRAEIKYQRG